METLSNSGGGQMTKTIDPSVKNVTAAQLEEMTEKVTVDERPRNNSNGSSTATHPSRDASRRSSANSPQSSSYQLTASGLVLIKPTSDGSIPVDLTNFAAEIVEDILKDDGVEICRFFKIKSSLGGRRFSFDVPAERFASMSWATEYGRQRDRTPWPR